MSTTKGAKNVDYDDDDLDYYDDEPNDAEEMSPEDKASMREGKDTVRGALDPSFEVSDKEIEDALWYYYFDIPKSIAYLQSKKAPTQPKQKKLPSKFDQAAQSAQNKTTNGTHGRDSGQFVRSVTASSAPSNSTASFFRDTPWLNVPKDRLGLISIIPLRPAGKLLGGSATEGSGKPSKLAVLAAARKKAQEEKRKADEGSHNASSSRASLLDRLAMRKPSAVDGNDATIERNAPATSSNSRDSTVRSFKKLKIASEESENNTLSQLLPSSIGDASKNAVLEQSQSNSSRDIRAGPSTFARTMLGHHLEAKSVMSASEIPFTLPYPPEYRLSADSHPFSGPSPDDVVSNAQAKGSKPGKTATKTASGEKNATDLANGIEAIKIDPPAKVKSKGLDVVAEYEKSNAKRAASFVVIGHVDHGKSTLMGRLLYELKLVDDRSVDKLRREADSIGKSSFAFAWLMDSTSEERQHGVTVDIATRHFETEKTQFTILDAPGHRDFIPNMISGASQADFAILVVDASTNAFESGLRGQTKEHALLVRSLGISHLIVAVNKMDAADWSEARFMEVQQQTAAFLMAAGFQTKKISFVPCCGLTGQNIVAKMITGPSSMQWYTGKSLTEELDAFEVTTRAINEPLRYNIADVFRGGINNPLSVSGKMEAGTCQIGDLLLVMPSEVTAAVKGIEFDEKSVDWAVAGQIITLHLTELDSAYIKSGNILCDPARRPITNVKAFTTKVLAFEHLMPMPLDLHKGSLHTSAKITSLIALLNKSNGTIEKKKPRVIKPGTVARIRVELELPLPLEASSRVVFRNEGVTIAAGLIESVE